MRAEKTGDLLYSGQRSDPPAESCRVDMIFDNSDLAIPYPEKEVIISRELRRNGQSVYRLNDKRMSKTEIMEKLKIAGIDGASSRNVIQQGRVAQIVSMSGEERRGVIEDVAGTAQFDEKKVEAEKGLEEASRRLDELGLLVLEVEKQYRVLKKENERLQSYLNLSNQLKDLKGRLFSLKMKKHKENMESIKEKQLLEQEELNRLEESKDSQVNQKIDELAKKIENQERELEEHQLLLENKSKEFHNQEIELVKSKEEIKHIENEKTKLGKENAKFDKQISDYQSKLDTSDEKMANLSDELENYYTSKTELTESIEVAKGEVTELEKLYDTKDIELQDTKKELRVVDDRITRIEYQLNMSESIRENIEKSLQQKEDSITSITQQLDEHNKTLSDVSEKSKELEEKILNHTNIKNSVTNDLEVLDATVNELETKLRMVDDELLSIDVKSKTLNNFLKSTSGDSAGYKFIMKLKSEGFKGIEDKLQKIYPKSNLPNNLAHLADAIVVEKVETSIEIIKKLKKEAIGTETFIPRNALSDDKNIKESWKFLDLILEKSDVAGNIDNSWSKWKNQREKIVLSDEGDEFRPNGVIFGGYHSETAKAELEELEKLAIRKKEDKTNLENEQVGLKVNKTELLSQRKEADENLGQLEKLKLTINNQVSRIEEAKKHNQQLLEQYEQEKLPLIMQIEDKNSHVEDQSNEKKILSEKRISLAEQIQVLAKEVESINLEGTRKNLSDKERDFQGIENQIFRIDSQLESVTNISEESKRQIDMLENQIKENNESIESFGLKYSEIQVELDSLQGKLDQADSETVNIKSEGTTKKKEIKDSKREWEKLHQDLEEVQGTILSVKEKVHKFDIEEERISGLMNAIENDAIESEIDLATITEESISKDNIPGLEKQMQRIEGQIKDILPVNMKAGDEYEIVNKRFTEIKEQQEILIDEREAITDFIAQIEIEKASAFMKVFNTINKNFKRFFAELSEGKAEIVLENPEKIFEAGVIINASPRGKKVKSLEAMSGGEKALCALSFIFSMQQVDYQPFYVLDEVDAALDPGNVDKLGKLIFRLSQEASLKKKGKGAQFIVISHREQLMSKANLIWGVTSVQGVSSIFSFSLDDYRKQQTKANGNEISEELESDVTVQVKG
jgi:chromosome segregation protein